MVLLKKAISTSSRIGEIDLGRSRQAELTHAFLTMGKRDAGDASLVTSLSLTEGQIHISEGGLRRPILVGGHGARTAAKVPGEDVLHSRCKADWTPGEGSPSRNEGAGQRKSETRAARRRMYAYKVDEVM